MPLWGGFSSFITSPKVRNWAFLFLFHIPDNSLFKIHVVSWYSALALLMARWVWYGEDSSRRDDS